MLVCCFVFVVDFSPFSINVLSRFHCFREARDVGARRSECASLQRVAVRGAGIRKSRAEAEERVGQVRERRVRFAHEKILMHTGDACAEASLILSDSRVNRECCWRKVDKNGLFIQFMKPQAYNYNAVPHTMLLPL